MLDSDRLPKSIEIRRIRQEQAADFACEALGILVQIMRDEKAPPNVRSENARTVIAYGWGLADRIVRVENVDKQLIMELQAIAMPDAVRALEGTLPPPDEESSRLIGDGSG